MTNLFLATDNGLSAAVRSGSNWERLPKPLLDRPLTSVAVQGSMILAGTRQGLYHSADSGQNWQRSGEGTGIKHVRWLAYHPQKPELALAGAEPAAIYVSADGGRSWSDQPEVAEMRDRLDWFLPYSPEAGCVRGFAASEQRLYAAVEVGGLLSSEDGGASWQLVAGSDGQPKFGTPQPNFIHPDVHSIELHPSSPERLFAPTGGGFYTSADAGRSWQESHPPCYCRAVWVDPVDAEHLVLGPARSVDSSGRIVESTDGGHSWIDLDEGLEVPWPRTMVERFAQMEGSLFAILSDGRLLEATIGEWRWRKILPEVGRVRALVAIS